MIYHGFVDRTKWGWGRQRLGVGMIYHDFVDEEEWVCGRKRVDLVVIYYDFVDEEEWVCGDTGRRCGHYGVGLWMRQGCFGGLSRV